MHFSGGSNGKQAAIVRPLQKVALKNPKVALNLYFVAEVAQEIRKSCAKVARNFAHFWCKMLLLSFGTLENFGNKQQNNMR